MDQNLDFEINKDNTGNTIYGGCGAMLMGQWMYFGGSRTGTDKQVC